MGVYIFLLLHEPAHFLLGAWPMGQESLLALSVMQIVVWFVIWLAILRFGERWKAQPPAEH